MNDSALLALVIALGAAVMQVTLPPVAAVCRRRGWLDRPREGKIHSTPTPRLTGVSIYLSIWAPLFAASLLIPDSMIEFNAHAAVLWSGGLAILALGMVDDVHPLSSWPKLIVQIAIGSMLFWSGIGFDRLWIPFVGGASLGLLALPVTLLWFLVVVNAVFFFLWLYRAVANLPALGSSERLAISAGKPLTPGRAVGVWFIPFPILLRRF